MRKWINKAVAAFMMLWFPAFTVLASDDWSDFDEDLPQIYTEDEASSDSQEEPSYSTEIEAASESYDNSAGTDSEAYYDTDAATAEQDPAYSSGSEPVYSETESAGTVEEPAYSSETESAYTAEEPAYSSETEPAATMEEPAYSSESTPDYSEEPSYGSELSTDPAYSEESSYSSEPVAQEPAYESDTEDSSLDVFGSSGAFDFVKIKRNEKKGESLFQNAIIEGVQVTTEEGASSDEKVITCYFIFRDKPSNYFYEVDHKNKRLVFEFNDTRTGSSPVTTIKEDPITGFEIEETQIDANKEIEGLNPEWHDQIRVTFNLKHIPVFTVSDDQDIISFKYKWTTDPEKIASYVQKDRFPEVFLWSGVGLGSLGVGLLSYFLLKKPPEPEVDPTLPIDDLPVRTAE